MSTFINFKPAGQNTRYELKQRIPAGAVTTGISASDTVFGFCPCFYA
jgi:hypothetical protein